MLKDKAVRSKHTSRLPENGQDSPRWRGTQVWLRMLGYMPEVRFKAKDAYPQIFTEFPPGLPADNRIYGDRLGDVYLDATGKGYVVLSSESDAEELAAGQVGPMG